jgi:peptidoglycan/xylan/chitin deacetylase (PgdA/CDA1 family)
VQNSHKPRFVTTSWDDGDCADLKLAELLQSKGIHGTFYIPINYWEKRLRHGDLRTLASEGSEIGAHGWSHRRLWRLQPEEVGQEVRPCKYVLEDILGKQVEMFCYSCGRYDTNAVRALQVAGYRGARTFRMLATRPTFNPFGMPTTLQAFPHVPFTYLKNVARARSLESLQSCFVQMPRLGSWVELGKRLFDAVLEDGGVWHLYGHSWDIEMLRLWEGLRDLLDYVCRREAVRYVSNCALLQPQSVASFAR